MARSTAGKARISIVWMVTVGVLFLVAVFFGFVTQSDLSAEQKKSADAAQQTAEITARLSEQQELRRNISTILGWYDRDSADPESDVELAKKGLEDLRSTFPDIGAAEKDFQTALDKIGPAYNERGRQIDELQARVRALESELAAAQAATAQVSGEKDTTINGLRQQVADEQKNAQQRESELEGRLEALRTQLAERDGELRKSREDFAGEKRKLEDELNIRSARINHLSDVTKFAEAPFADQPDGRILEVSERLGTGWIDRGANQRVARGMRFQIQSGRPGERRTKAWAEVTNVKGDSAEVAISGIVDRYDPVVAGDLILNPVYDPVGGRNAVLIGRFSGAYNEQELATLLARMGINVQPRLDLTTHFLIVGSELWSDPETSEPLEQPIQPSELPAYKEAESKGVQIIPLQDIREYFRVGAGS